MAGEHTGGWVLSAVMDKKERGPALSGWPSLVRLYGGLPCRCSYTIPHFFVVVNNFLVTAGAFAGCCIGAACGRPLEVRPRPRAGGGWAPAGLVALQVTALLAASGVAVIWAGRQRSRWWPAGPLPDDFGRLWGFCGCRRDWAEPIGAARCSRGDVRDKKGLDKIGGRVVWCWMSGAFR